MCQCWILGSTILFWEGKSKFLAERELCWNSTYLFMRLPDANWPTSLFLICCVNNNQIKRDSVLCLVAMHLHSLHNSTVGNILVAVHYIHWKQGCIIVSQNCS